MKTIEHDGWDIEPRLKCRDGKLFIDINCWKGDRRVTVTYNISATLTVVIINNHDVIKPMVSRVLTTEYTRHVAHFNCNANKMEVFNTAAHSFAEIIRIFSPITPEIIGYVNPHFAALLRTTIDNL